MSDLASLIIRIQALGATEARQAMDALTASAGTAEVATKSLSAAQVSFVRQQLGGDAAIIASRGSVAAGQLLYAEALAKSNAAQTASAASAKIAGEATKALGVAAGAGVVAHKELGAAANEMEKVLARTGGTALRTRESLVLLHEFMRGDFRRAIGSATIELQAFGLLGAVFSPIGIVIGVTAATLGVLAFAALKGEQEMSKLSGSLIATGGYAGLTTSSLMTLAQTVATSSDTTIGSSRKTVEALAESGRFGSASIASLSDAAQNYARITGENADKFVKEYDGMTDHLVKWAVKHQDTYHDLSLLQIEQIALLVKHGQEARAQDVLTADLDEASKKRLDEKIAEEVSHYGTLQRALHETAKAASDMWDKLLGIGRGKTIDEQISAAQANVKAADTAYNNQGGRQNNQALSSAELRLATLQGLKTVQDEGAAAKGAAAARVTSAIDAKFGEGKTRGGKGPQDASDQAIDQATKDELVARAALTKNITELADFKLQEVAADLKLKDDRLDREVKEKRITVAAADIAKGKEAEAAREKDALILRNRDFDLQAETLKQRQAVLTYTQQTAQIDAQLAPTAARRAAIENKALADKQAEARDALTLANARAVAEKSRTTAEAAQLVVAQALTQAAQRSLEAEKHRVAAIEERAGLERSSLETQASIILSQASILRSTYAQAVEAEKALKYQQQAALVDAQALVDKTIIGSAAHQEAEDALARLKAQQAADKVLAERKTRLVDAVRDAGTEAQNFVNALKNRDFGKALDELLAAIETIKKAFEKYGIAGGLAAGASAIGHAIGGKVGNAIGDAGSAAATALTLTGNPVIAAAAAAVVAIFDLAKPKPSNNGAIATFAGDTFALSGDKRNSTTSSLASIAGNAILQGEAALRAAGITLNTTIKSIDIGTRDATHILLSNGQELRSAVGDSAAAAETALKAMLSGATYASDAEKKLVTSLLAAGKGFDAVATALQGYAAAQQVSKAIGDQILQLKDPKAFDLKAVHDGIDAQRKAAQAAATAGYLTADQLSKINDQLGTLEGLQIDVVMKKYANATTAATAIMAQATTNVDDARKAAQASYDSQVAAYQAIITKAQAAADSLGKFRDSLTSGPLANLSATGQLSATRTQFNALAALPAGSPARLAGLEAAGSAFLTAAQAGEPTRLAYARDLAAVRRAADESAQAALTQVSDAQQQIDALNEMVKGQLTIVAAVKQGSADIVGALGALAAAEQVVANLVITEAAKAAAAQATPTAPVNDNTALTAPAPNGPTPPVDPAALAAAIGHLGVQVSGLQAAVVNGAAYQKQTADLLRRVTRDGESLMTTAA